MENQGKKIGCVIAYNEGHNNYGTSLQGYAHLKKIQELGYKCEVIRYRKYLSLFQRCWQIIQMFRIGAFQGKVSVIKEKIDKRLYSGYAKNMQIRTIAVNRYKEEKLKPLFKEYNGFENLRKGSLNYSAVIVGSDQVWTPISLYNKYYNLLFVDDSVPKISYASSFGVSEIPDIQKEQTAAYLNRFAKIGVRELAGKTIVETISQNKAEVVCDPTLLLTSEEWAEEIAQSTVDTTEPYIFCYFLGTNPDMRQAADKLKQKTGLKIIAIRHLDEYLSSDEQFGDEAPYDVSPNDFVKYISKAQYVCTDSFHCTIFSILFHRRFMSFYRFKSSSKNSRNSRIDSLFALTGLQERLFTGDINQMEKDINYSEVDEKLNVFRKDSLQFLRKSLELAK